MSLATRCTHCGTIFRVVQDQLKVSEGWVRCGRCQDVFNALQNLFDLEREAPPPWPPAAVPAPNWHSTQHPEEEAPPPTDSMVTMEDRPDPAIYATQPLLHTASREHFHAPDDEDKDSGFADARFNLDLLDDETRSSTPAEALAALHALDHPPPPPPAPEFIRQADREARWQHPAVRAGLVTALVASTLLLIGQAGVHFRQQTVAHWPGAHALLDPLCAALKCSNDPPRQLESLAVDATGLTKLDPPGTYRLSVSLHNRASVAVMLPAVELSLTDAQGQLVARRVLQAGEMGAVDRSVPAGSDVALQATLSTGDRRVVGYTVDIFYP